MTEGEKDLERVLGSIEPRRRSRAILEAMRRVRAREQSQPPATENGQEFVRPRFLRRVDQAHG